MNKLISKINWKEVKLRNLLSTLNTFDNSHLRILEHFHLLNWKKLIKYKLKNGLKMFVRPGTSDTGILLQIARDNEYFKFFSPMQNDNVVDIGANFGAFSCLAAINNPSCTIHAYEPFTPNFLLFKKNIRLNSLQNINAYNAAVDENDGTIDLFLEKTLFSDISRTPKPEAIKFTIPSVSLETILARIGICDFLKIDCEGNEYPILLNTDKEIFGSIRKIVVEYHQSTLGTKGDLEKKFIANNYSIYTIEQNNQLGLIFAEKRERLVTYAHK